MLRKLLIFFFGVVGLATTANAAWYKAETDNFIVYMEDSRSDVRELAEKLERLNFVMRTLNGITAEPSPEKLRVFVVSNMRAVQGYEGARRSNINVAGFYYAPARGPYAVVPRRDLGRGTFATSAEAVLFHEYAHHFMLQNMPANYPPWYVEGFAEFYGSMRLPGGNHVELGRVLNSHAPNLHFQDWIPIEELLSNERPSTSMMYSQAWLLTHYAFFNPETTQILQRYLNALQGGSTPSEAYLTTFGLTGVDYDEVLQEYRDGQSRILSLGMDEMPEFEVTITELPRAEVRIALLMPHTGERGVRIARDRVEDYPDMAQAHVELARLLIEEGEISAGLASAEQAIELDANNIEAHIFKGIALIEMALDSGEHESPHWQQARDSISIANRMNPNNPLALYSFYRAYPGDDERPEVVDQALEVAYNIVPQSAEIRATMIRELVFQGRYQGALRILPPLLRPPHGAASNSGAQEMQRYIRKLMRDEAAEEEEELELEETADSASN